MEKSHVQRVKSNDIKMHLIHLRCINSFFFFLHECIYDSNDEDDSVIVHNETELRQKKADKAKEISKHQQFVQESRG